MINDNDCCTYDIVGSVKSRWEPLYIFQANVSAKLRKYKFICYGMDREVPWGSSLQLSNSFTLGERSIWKPFEITISEIVQANEVKLLFYGLLYFRAGVSTPFLESLELCSLHLARLEWNYKNYVFGKLEFLFVDFERNVLSWIWEMIWFRWRRHVKHLQGIIWLWILGNGATVQLYRSMMVQEGKTSEISRRRVWNLSGIRSVQHSWPLAQQ